MKTALSILLALIIIGGAFFLYEQHDADNGSIVATSTQGLFARPAASSSPASSSASTTPSVSTADIRVTLPHSGATVTSPLTVTGEARGNWFFEGSAPVYLMDASGRKIAEGQINSTGDWMTTNFVPFTGVLTWTGTTTGTSTAASVVFMNDNPSGNPSLQKSVTVPVKLQR